jgi:hypothetical protein
MLPWVKARLEKCLSPGEDYRVQSALSQEVYDLLCDGKLHPWDALWIHKLPQDKQLVAAKKTMANFHLNMSPMDSPKSRIAASRAS